MLGLRPQGQWELEASVSGIKWSASPTQIFTRNAWAHEPRPWSCLGNAYWSRGRIPANISSSDFQYSWVRGGDKKAETGWSDTLGSSRHQLPSLSSKNHHRRKLNANVHEFFRDISHLKNHTEHIPWKSCRHHHHDWHSQVHSTSHQKRWFWLGYTPLACHLPGWAHCSNSHINHSHEVGSRPGRWEWLG